jgi:hypothetical protein
MTFSPVDDTADDPVSRKAAALANPKACRKPGERI